MKPIPEIVFGGPCDGARVLPNGLYVRVRYEIIMDARYEGSPKYAHYARYIQPNLEGRLFADYQWNDKTKRYEWMMPKNLSGGGTSK